jgi:D-lactate dehydrogenase
LYSKRFLFSALLARPNVLITGHQGFLTREALGNIATSALTTLDLWLAGQPAPNQLRPAEPASTEVASLLVAEGVYLLN